MKTLLYFSALAIVLFPLSGRADQYVRGYTRSNGTYVQGYTRSSPDNTVTNNYSFEGNANPYTGAVGTNRVTHDATSPYFGGPDANGNVGHAGVFGEQ